MCIRDSLNTVVDVALGSKDHTTLVTALGAAEYVDSLDNACLLYTSDAADERSSVDLGGRRIIKKKKKRNSKARNCISTQNITLSE